jgi:hypothetical protein
VHALLDAALGARGDAEKLDAVAEIVSGLDIRGRDGLDAFDIDGVESSARAEGERR